MADSVSLFGEGTFEEQIRELVDYLARGLADESRIAFIRPFSEGLVRNEHQKLFDEDPERRKKIISMVLAEVKGLGQGSEREIEGFFNLLFAHTLSLFPETAASQQRISPLLSTVSSAPSDSPVVKYKILSNLFNALPRKSPLRLEVYKTILPLAASHKDLDVLQISKSGVDTWLAEWDISAEQQSIFLKSIADAFLSAGQPEGAYPYLLSRIQTLPHSTSPEVAKSAAIDIAVTALQLPVAFDLSDFTKLQSIRTHLANHPLLALLTILSNDDLSAWNAWRKGNTAILADNALDAAYIDRKIRYLTLASLAGKHIGGELSYSDIASTLEIEISSVEAWIIDAIRAKVLSGKLSQPTQTFYVTRATTTSYHPFNQKAQWESLEKKLLAWRAGLVNVLDVIAGAREQAFGTEGGKDVRDKEVKEKGPIVHGDLAAATSTA